jgi:hypothetical protein
MHVLSCLRELNPQGQVPELRRRIGCPPAKAGRQARQVSGLNGARVQARGVCKPRAAHRASRLASSRRFPWRRPLPGQGARKNPPRALALSDKQLALLQRAAASLPVGERDHFLQSVAAHLNGQPTDDAVIAAINAALDAAAVA